MGAFERQILIFFFKLWMNLKKKLKFSFFIRDFRPKSHFSKIFSHFCLSCLEQDLRKNPVSFAKTLKNERKKQYLSIKISLH
jgi:hypothetical protein